MSVHWIDRVWSLSGQKGSALLLMLALADSSNDDGLSYPGQEFLAKKTRLSERHVISLVEHVVTEKEVAVDRGGSGAKDTNQYIILLGRESAELDRIIADLASGKGAKFALYGANKGEKISPLRKAKGEKISPLRVKNTPHKGELASSPDPLTMDGAMPEWMKDDPICQFLRNLPGFNPIRLEDTRLEIVAHHYDLTELPYLWAECEGADNPIGLFTYKVTAGQHSADWQRAQMAQAEQAEQQQLAAAQQERIEAELAQRAVEPAAPPAPDPSLDRPLPGHEFLTPAEAWQAARGELQLEMTRATFETWVKPAVLLSVNGTWRIGVPDAVARAWLGQRLRSTIQRIMMGVTGAPVTIEFVVVPTERVPARTRGASDAQP